MSKRRPRLPSSVIRLTDDSSELISSCRAMQETIGCVSVCTNSKLGGSVGSIWMLTVPIDRLLSAFSR